MSIRSRMLSLWWNLFRRRRAEQSLDDELRAYVDLAAGEYERSGMQPAEARRRATIDAGGVEQIKEGVRDAWTGNWIAMAWRDMTYSLRSLRRNSAFAVVAVATLALGLAGATAVFSIINAVLLRPLPGIAEPRALVTLLRVQPKAILEEFAYPDFMDFRANTRTLSGVAAQVGWGMRLGEATGERHGIVVDFVTGEYFSVLGVRAVLGRLLTPADEDAGRGNTVLVLRYDMWRDQFDGDSTIIGRALLLNGAPFTVVGVASEGFGGTMMAHVVAAWAPVSAILTAPGAGLSNDILADRGAGWLDIFGRLKAGATVADAQTDLSAIAARLALAYQTNVGRSVRVTPFAPLYMDEERDARNLFRLLGAAVALLLLLACVNVAGLSLVRASSRQRELASRLALGASRLALVRQLAIEGMLIAGAAAIVGTLAATMLVHSRSMVRAALTNVPLVDAPLDVRVLAFALCAATSTAILVSILPAIRASRANPITLLKDGTFGAGRRRSNTQRSLVAVQAAASLMLLTVASLVFSAVHRLITADPGFDPRNVSTTSLDPREEGYDSTRTLTFFRTVLDRASATPGIESAALATIVPPSTWASRTAVFRAEEAPSREALQGHSFEAQTRAYIDEVSPSFFATLRIPILRGRGFTAHDNPNAPPVVIVSRRLAERLWPHLDPIGKYLAWPEDDHGATPRPPSEVVGVSGDTKHSTLADSSALVMYVPLYQQSATYANLVVRGREGEPNPKAMQTILASVDPGVPIGALGTLRGKMLASVVQQRTASLWIGVLGAIALVLASIGLYGVAAQSVVQRTRELAVRSALGATPTDLASLILREGLWLAVAGVVGGVVLAIIGARGIQRSLPGIDGVDPLLVTACAALLAVVMLGATYIPARRAARLNPVDALRCE